MVRFGFQTKHCLSEYCKYEQIFYKLKYGAENGSVYMCTYMYISGNQFFLFFRFLNWKGGKHMYTLFRLFFSEVNRRVAFSGCYKNTTLSYCIELKMVKQKWKVMYSSVQHMNILYLELLFCIARTTRKFYVLAA